MDFMNIATHVFFFLFDDVQFQTEMYLGQMFYIDMQKC